MKSPVVSRLLRRERAAAYLGLSPATFDQMVKNRALPPPKRIGASIKAWDVHDLDAQVDALPYDDDIVDLASGNTSELDRRLGTG